MTETGQVNRRSVLVSASTTVIPSIRGERKLTRLQSLDAVTPLEPSLVVLAYAKRPKLPPLGGPYLKGIARNPDAVREALPVRVRTSVVRCTLSPGR